jgi:hypothetical protein
MAGLTEEYRRDGAQGLGLRAVACKRDEALAQELQGACMRDEALAREPEAACTQDEALVREPEAACKTASLLFFLPERTQGLPLMSRKRSLPSTVSS